ncbi:hypothetical protein [Luteibacter sp. RCC_6_2]|uniref:hypothetical protein n=1 Tax=Luteibacter sp. RCC_6_2 TaxID=3239223 RepID=UPI0035255FBE
METLFVDITDVDQLWSRRLRDVPADPAWDVSDEREPRMHRIHAYPAKFPAFIATRAFAYARGHGLNPRRVADVFCGCGTVAHEAQRAGLAFWGCDINPVATLIARTKSARLDPQTLLSYLGSVLRRAERGGERPDLSPAAEERLRRWFQPGQFDALGSLLAAIREETPTDSMYRDAYECMFSAILKACSQWRQRSIKPALHPTKIPSPVLPTFAQHMGRLARALSEEGRPAHRQRPVEIHRANALTVARPERLVSMIISSPPYVTSYEYADLHQLSSLWLGYADDYRDLRAGSIGSAQHSLNLKRSVNQLNRIGNQVVFSLYDQDRRAASAVANYYIDMQAIARRCRELLAPQGIAMFVIGNTKYAGVDIDNASHLAESLLDAGFGRVRAVRRTISNKIATPFRDNSGRFSRTRTGHHVYAHEYVLMAHL